MVACRFIDSDGWGYLDGAISCLRKCREEAGANITSNSWGGGSYSQALRDEIQVCVCVGGGGGHAMAGRRWPAGRPAGGFAGCTGG